MTDYCYTVSEVQSEARTLLEEQFRDIWVEGEISGLSRSGPGHCYFTLKDDLAQLSSVMWRSTLERVKFEPESGLAVRARGYLTIYERAGRYQFIVQRLEPLGAGPLQVKFEQMRKRLEKEGLFDPARKRELPTFPRRVALVTSPTGAAVRDLIHVAQRRWPILEIVIVPVRVQGDGAAAEVAAGIRAADGMDFDVIVCGRGGGSPEDLWAFNEEVVARAIASAKTPVVSAVGHEVDVSISDLVADVRAATPSAAAEAITPDRAELAALLRERRRRLANGLRQRLTESRGRVRQIEASRVFRRPLDLIDERQLRLDDGRQRLGAALGARLQERRGRIEVLAAELDALSPLKVLGRGYSVTRKDGTVVTRATQVSAGDELETLLAEGKLRSRALGD